MNVEDENSIEYIIGSIDLIYEWFGHKSIEVFENDIKTTDAICTRLYYIGKAFGKLSDNTQQLVIEAEAGMLSLFFIEHFYDDETLWDILNGYDGSPTLKSYSEVLRSILLNKSIQSKDKNTEILSTDYKYSIKTSKSIWTVKNK